MEELKFICDEPVLLYRGILIVADLHLGVERGIFGSAETNLFERAGEKLSGSQATRKKS